MFQLSITGDPVAKGRHRTALMMTDGDLALLQHGPMSYKEMRRHISSRIRQHSQAKTTKFELIVRNAAVVKMGFDRPYLGAVTCRISFRMRIPKSWPNYKRAQAANGTLRPVSVPDLDNLTKAITDALNGVVYRDDAQITDLILTKRYSHEPGIVVTIAEVNPIRGIDTP